MTRSTGNHLLSLVLGRDTAYRTFLGRWFKVNRGLWLREENLLETLQERARDARSLSREGGGRGAANSLPPSV